MQVFVDDCVLSEADEDYEVRMEPKYLGKELDRERLAYYRKRATKKGPITNSFQICKFCPRYDGQPRMSDKGLVTHWRKTHWKITGYRRTRNKCPVQDCDAEFPKHRTNAGRRHLERHHSALELLKNGVEVWRYRETREIPRAERRACVAWLLAELYIRPVGH